MEGESNILYVPVKQEIGSLLCNSSCIFHVKGQKVPNRKSEESKSSGQMGKRHWRNIICHDPNRCKSVFIQESLLSRKQRLSSNSYDGKTNAIKTFLERRSGL